MQGAFDAYAMGNYHFPSDYMTGQGKDLPAWPMRAACKELTNLPAPSATHVTAKATGMAAVTTATARRLLGFGQRQQDNHADAVVAGAANAAGLADTALLVKMRKAVALLYNATGDASCFTLDILGPGAASTGGSGVRAREGTPRVGRGECDSGTGVVLTVLSACMLCVAEGSAGLLCGSEVFTATVLLLEAGCIVVESG